jgi:hypothetical protein
MELSTSSPAGGVGLRDTERCRPVEQDAQRHRRWCECDVRSARSESAGQRVQVSRTSAEVNASGPIFSPPLNGPGAGRSRRATTRSWRPWPHHWLAKKRTLSLAQIAGCLANLDLLLCSEDCRVERVVRSVHSGRPRAAGCRCRAVAPRLCPDSPPPPR